jgi:hypothetical protein
MLEDGLEVVLVPEGEDEVGLVDHENLEGLLERQVAGLEVGDHARGDADDDVRQISDELELIWGIGFGRNLRKN